VCVGCVDHCNMSSPIFTCPGGTVVLPTKILCDRGDGGHLIVNPPRAVWERSCLTPLELVQWSLLVAATGQAMLETLPVLQDGCINYWEAGNWALHPMAEPVGPKTPILHRRVHLHLLGRSPHAQHPDWRWGESPRFPDYAESDRWCAQFAPLIAQECADVVERLTELMKTRYHLPQLAALPKVTL
jgi:hypothetical protein